MTVVGRCSRGAGGGGGGGSGDDDDQKDDDADNSNSNDNEPLVLLEYEIVYVDLDHKSNEFVDLYTQAYPLPDGKPKTPVLVVLEENEEDKDSIDEDEKASNCGGTHQTTPPESTMASDDDKKKKKNAAATAGTEAVVGVSSTSKTTTTTVLYESTVIVEYLAELQIQQFQQLRQQQVFHKFDDSSSALPTSSLPSPSLLLPTNLERRAILHLFLYLFGESTFRYSSLLKSIYVDQDMKSVKDTLNVFQQQLVDINAFLLKYDTSNDAGGVINVGGPFLFGNSDFTIVECIMAPYVQRCLHLMANLYYDSCNSNHNR